MLELKVHDREHEVVLKFEHSLLSLSKWESKHKKPFMSRDQKTPTELFEYFQDMLLSPEDDPDLVYLLSPEQMDELGDYINQPQSASSVPDDGKKQINSETITSELMYYWLVAMKIPFQPTESWHVSRVLMLVQITNYKNQPAKKRRPAEVMADWRRINEERKQKYNTSG